MGFEDGCVIKHMKYLRLLKCGFWREKETSPASLFNGWEVEVQGINIIPNGKVD